MPFSTIQFPQMPPVWDSIDHRKRCQASCCNVTMASVQCKSCLNQSGWRERPKWAPKGQASVRVQALVKLSGKRTSRPTPLERLWPARMSHPAAPKGQSCHVLSGESLRYQYRGTHHVFGVRSFFVSIGFSRRSCKKCTRSYLSPGLPMSSMKY